MDGSRSAPGADSASSATRLALTVDREAVGLMRHASQTGHLVEWWLQGAGAAVSPLAALRLGRKLERFRLAARLAEGRASRQVQIALDALRQELALHAPPPQILAELDQAALESTRLASCASKAPPTVVYREAFQSEPEPESAPIAGPPRRRSGTLLMLLALMTAAALAYLWPQPIGDLIARLSGL